MTRFVRLALVAAILFAMSAASGCQPKAEVRTGTHVVCTYGHVVSDNVRTIEVPASDVGKYQVRTVTRVCDRHAKLENLYAQAQAAIKSGDLKSAEDKLAQVVAIDSGFGKAKTQLDTIIDGKKPTADSSDPSPDGPATGDKPANPGEGDTGVPAASLLRWAPDTLPGYAAAKPVLDPLNIAREYVPESDSGPLTLVIVADQTRNSTGAKNALNTQVKASYTADKDTVEINGHSMYFGTDSNRYAALGFVDGSVMVAIEMSTRPGESPKSLKAALLAVAKQLP